MKTSSPQFDLMVTYMELNGDISVRCNGRGLIDNLNKWEELTESLNSFDCGETKTVAKWKKVWSDFKNNTRKKALRLHKNAVAGKPDNLKELSDIEQRVLNLVGLHVATDLEVKEDGLSQVSQSQSMPTTQPTKSEYEPGPSTLYVLPTLRPCQVRTVYPVPNTYQARTITTAPNVANRIQIQQDDQAQSVRLSPQINDIRTVPARSGQTKRRTRNLRSHQRMPRLVQEVAAQNYYQSKEYWKFKNEQHREKMSLLREQNRIREMEVQSQREWQAIGIRVLDILDKVVNKFCNDK